MNTRTYHPDGSMTVLRPKHTLRIVDSDRLNTAQLRLVSLAFDAKHFRKGEIIAKLKELAKELDAIWNEGGTEVGLTKWNDSEHGYHLTMDLFFGKGNRLGEVVSVTHSAEEIAEARERTRKRMEERNGIDEEG